MMRNLIWAIWAAWFACLVRSQNTTFSGLGLPPCTNACLAVLLLPGSGCDFTALSDDESIRCFCQHQALVQAVVTCAQKSCPPDDQKTVFAAGIALCEIYGVSLAFPSTSGPFTVTTTVSVTLGTAAPSSPPTTRPSTTTGSPTTVASRTATSSPTTTRPLTTASPTGTTTPSPTTSTPPAPFTGDANMIVRNDILAALLLLGIYYVFL